MHYATDLIGACNIRVSDLQKGVREQAAGTFEGDYFPFGCHDGHLAYASIDDGGKTMALYIMTSEYGPHFQKNRCLSICTFMGSRCETAERIFWYSRDYQDWNINAGLEAKPVKQHSFLKHRAQLESPPYSVQPSITMVMSH